MGGAFVHKHEGVTVKFCCEGCVGDFQKDPKKFLAKLEAAKKGELPEATPETPEKVEEKPEAQEGSDEKPEAKEDGENENPVEPQE